jgi:prepilin-type N-terminal cleavage/methylation domain-containing protein
MNKNRESGFTFIELLIALFVLTVALLAISSMVYSVMNSTSLSKETATATALMQDKMESLKHTVVASLTSGNDTIQLGNVDYLRQWSITPIPPPPTPTNARSITVTVSWTSRGPHTVSMTTMRGE